MPKAIQISSQSTVWMPRLQAYKLVVEAINPQEMPAEVFIKQRMRNFAQESFEDSFVGVCTPDQLETFPVNSPSPDSSFYRVSKIDIIGRMPETIETIFDTLLYEVQKLVEDLNSLDYLEEIKIYNIDVGGTSLLPSSLNLIDGGIASTIFNINDLNIDGGATDTVYYQTINGGGA